MASAALAHLASLLQARKLDGTLTRPLSTEVPCASTGVFALDQAVAGGWPRGQLSEVVGPPSSGRTSVLVATMAEATRQGGVVALVDVADRFDPRAAFETGLDLDRMLWVRGPAISWDPTRTTIGDLAVRRAIRAFDLIIRAGGFSVVALDLSDVPARSMRSLPMTTWLRLAHANEGRASAGLLVGEAPMGRSAGGLSVSLRATGQWAGASAQSRRFAGLEVRPQVVRSARHADQVTQSARQLPARGSEAVCFSVSSGIR